jgi:small-conductance mechanosensitive channel
VRLWDWRRLVVPLSYFMEKPFQNWTRESASLIGTVFWIVGYGVPVAEARERFLAIVKASPLWDGQVAALQVTDANEKGMQLRGIMSARSGSDSWELRCEVREKLIAWLRGACPHALPNNVPESDSPVQPHGHVQDAGSLTKRDDIMREEHS